MLPFFILNRAVLQQFFTGGAKFATTADLFMLREMYRSRAEMDARN
jgi:hypothetical protein